MKAMGRWLAGVCLIGMACLSARPAFSQQATDKALIPASNGTIYIVDFVAGSAVPIPFKLPAGTSLAMSPDQKYLLSFGADGIILYQVSGSNIQQSAQVTQAAATSVRWSADSNAVAYSRETKNADGSVSVQMYLWSRETGQTKRLL